MERTRPIANFHPQIVQYRPAESSMLKTVAPLVRPSSSSFAFVRTNTSANLNFTNSTPRAPRPAAPFPQGDRCFVPSGRLSRARLKSRTRAETTLCWVESGGRSSSAWRHTARAALTSPTCEARSASAARRLRSSEWTRRWQDGQASRAGAICVPHWGQTSGACPAASASVIGEALRGRRSRRSLVGTGDTQRDAPVELPRLVQSEPGDNQMQRTGDPDQDGRRVRERHNRGEPENQDGRSGGPALTTHAVAGGREHRGPRSVGARARLLPQLARDHRRIGDDDGRVSEEYRQRLISPPPAPAGALAHRTTHKQPDQNGDQAEVDAGGREYRKVDSRAYHSLAESEANRI